MKRLILAVLMLLAFAGAASSFSDRAITPWQGTAQDEPRLAIPLPGDELPINQDPCLGPDVRSGCDIGNHEKVFSNAVLAVDPPCYEWICRRCGAEGRDCDKPSNWGEYDRLKKFWKERK